MNPRPASSLPPPPPPGNLLVRGVNWLGDAVMTTPALLRLREALPNTRITILTASKLAELWEHHPAVDQVLTFSPGESPWLVARRLRRERFDAALVLPNSPRSALECWLARIPRRIGFARPLRNWLLTEPSPPRPGTVRMTKPSPAAIQARLHPGARPSPPPPRSAHQTFEYLHLAAHLGASAEPLAPRLEVSDAEVGQARSRFGIDPALEWLALNPGAEYGPAKRWPAERFAEVAAGLESMEGARWILLGGPKDREATACIRSRVPGAIDLAGRTSLRELMAVLKACRVLLTNDTGPMHVGAALGLPVVVPFGSTSPILTGPGLPGDPRHHLLTTQAPCAPCFLRECPIDFRCLLGLDTTTVAGAVRQAWRTGPGSASGTPQS